MRQATLDEQEFWTDVSKNLDDVEKSANRIRKLTLIVILWASMLFFTLYILAEMFTPWIAVDLLLSMGTGLLAGAVVFWAVDVNLAKRTFESNRMREIYMFGYQLQRYNKLVLGFNKRAASYMGATEILFNQINHTDSDEHKIEILENILELNEAISNMFDDHESLLKVQTYHEQRVMATVTSGKAVELFQAIQEGVLIREHTLRGLDESRTILREQMAIVRDTLNSLRNRERGHT